jgi:hypothetical protein
VDEATWARGRGWALWKALITLAHDRGTRRREEARFGWRSDARRVVQEVLDEG